MEGLDRVAERGSAHFVSGGKRGRAGTLGKKIVCAGWVVLRGRAEHGEKGKCFEVWRFGR